MEIKYRSELHKIIDLTLPACEVGVAEGLFSRDILNWGIPKLYLVDVWETIQVYGDGASPQEWHDKNFQNVQRLMLPYGKDAVILKGLSVEMAKKIKDESLGFVYLDAGHSFEAVMADLEAYYPKVVCGGIIAGHDYLNTDYGVYGAVEQFCKLRGLEPILIPEDRTHDAGFYFKKIC